MTTRERWIVYPLLALALGSSIKSHIVRRFECDTLVARKIEIVDRRSRRQAVLQSTSEGGELSLHSHDMTAHSTISPGSIELRLHNGHGQEHTLLVAGRLQTTIVRASEVRAGRVNSGSVRVAGVDGKPQVVLEATPEGRGRLQLINKNNGATIERIAPRDSLVQPAKVNGKKPAKKKPEPKK